MSQRFVTIGKLAEARLVRPSMWWVAVEYGDDCMATFTTPFTPPPIGSAFEVRIVECGDFYGTG